MLSLGSTTSKDNHHQLHLLLLKWFHQMKAIIMMNYKWNWTYELQSQKQVLQNCKNGISVKGASERVRQSMYNIRVISKSRECFSFRTKTFWPSSITVSGAIALTNCSKFIFEQSTVLHTFDLRVESTYILLIRKIRTLEKILKMRSSR